MRRRGKIGLAILALALAGGGAYVGMERPRPPLVIRVAAQQEEAVQAAAQEEAPRILIYHTHTRESGNCGKSTSPIGRISFADRNNMLVKKPLSYTIYVTCAKLTCFCRK